MPTNQQAVNWEEYATVYDCLNDFIPYQKLQKEVLAKLDPVPDENILEAGCGTGNLFAWLKEIGQVSRVNWQGIDDSEAMLKKARQKHAGREAVFYCQNLDRPLALPSASFHKAVCINTLYALAKPQLLVEELARILPSSGRLVIINPKKGFENGLLLKSHCGDCGPDEPWLSANSDYAKQKILLAKAFGKSKLYKNFLRIAYFNRKIAENTGFHFFSSAELQKMILSAGFTIIETCNTYANQATMIVASREEAVINQTGGVKC